MSVFKRKQGNRINEMADHYVPTKLPVPGEELERDSPSCQTENFISTRYSINEPGEMEAAYGNLKGALEQELTGPITLTDKRSPVDYAKSWVDKLITTLYATLNGEISFHNNQLARIEGTKAARKQTLLAKIEDDEREKGENEEAITASDRVHKAAMESLDQRLQGHRAMFTLRLFGRDLPLCPLLTVGAMVFDAFVNYNAYQYILLSQALMLILTVVGMSFMSDVTMSVLASYVTRREEAFTSKANYYFVCASMLLLFAVSVVASLLVKIGCMPEMFGTINARGQAVPPDHYTLAHWSTTIINGLIPACTGILVYAVGVDKYSRLTSLRKLEVKAMEAFRAEKLEKIKALTAQIYAFRNEVTLIDAALTPSAFDAMEREAATVKIEAIRLALMVDAVTKQILQVNDPTIAEELSAYLGNLIDSASEGTLAVLRASSICPTTISLTKAS